jgi:hypothetical protein
MEYGIAFETYNNPGGLNIPGSSVNASGGFVSPNPTVGEVSTTPIPAAATTAPAVSAAPAAADPVPSYLDQVDVTDRFGGYGLWGLQGPSTPPAATTSAFSYLNQDIGFDFSGASKVESNIGGLATMGYEGLTAPAGLADGAYKGVLTLVNGELQMRPAAPREGDSPFTNGTLTVKNGRMNLSADPTATSLLQRGIDPAAVAKSMMVILTKADGTPAQNWYDAGVKLNMANGGKGIQSDSLKGGASGYVTTGTAADGRTMIIPLSKSGGTISTDPKTGAQVYTPAGGVPRGALYRDADQGILMEAAPAEDDSWGKDDWLAISPTIVSLVVGAGSFFLARSQMQQQKKLSDDARDTQLELLGMQLAARGSGGGGGGGGSSLNVGRLLS